MREKENEKTMGGQKRMKRTMKKQKERRNDGRSKEVRMKGTMG